MTTPAKERPILFSSPMVRAILAGRKTQTRRVVEERPRKDGVKMNMELLKSIGVGCACRFGAVGDRLWVRETWLPLWDSGAGFLTCLFPTGRENSPDAYKYRADGEAPTNFGAKWRPSIHMPRDASRITLEITGVRVERLQEISEEDAIAEGCQCSGVPASLTNRGAYAKLWESLHGPGSWDANPWVWVIEFTRLKVNNP